MLEPRLRRVRVASTVAIITAIVLILIEMSALLPGTATPLQAADLAARDLAMRLRGKQAPSAPIAIVAIDDFSFNWTGYQWPWPRAYLAKIVDQLNAYGARVIGLDVLLLEESADAQGDQALAASLSKARASVAVMQIFRDQAGSSLTLKLPVGAYNSAVSATGITEIAGSADPVVRSLGAFQGFGGETYFNWVYQVARLFLDVAPPSNPTPGSLLFNGRQSPLSQGRLLINYSGPAGSFPTYSAAQVVEGDYPAEAFRDKIVLIGATTATLHDLYPTPFSSAAPMPGVEIVANGIDTVLSGRYLRLAPPLASFVLIIIAAAAAWLVARRSEPILAIVLLVACMGAFAVAWYASFAVARVYLPLAAPEIMLFLGIVVPTVESSVAQELEKRRVRTMFGRFVSPEMIDEIMKSSDLSAVNRRAELTILFSDIRGFTTLSEKLAPEQVVALLNPYLSAMTGLILKHGGTVDKYEGDAIVAFFGQPVPYKDHALRALATAVEMCQLLSDLNRQWREQGQLQRKLEIGIGLNTGEVFVGLLGSEQRVNYTVIGDAVNLAARLQDQTKEFAWPILISGAVNDRIDGQFETEFADSRLVKGKTEPVKIYKVLGRKGAPDGERIRALFLDKEK